MTTASAVSTDDGFQVGDLVSECINGDQSPCVVVKRTPKMLWVHHVPYKATASVAYSEDKVQCIVDQADIERVLAEDLLGATKYVFYERRTPSGVRTGWHRAGARYFSLRTGAWFGRNPHV